MAGGFNLVARLKLQDDFSSRMRSVTNQMSRTERATKRMTAGVNNFTKSVGGIASAIGVTALVAGGFNAIRNSIDGAIDRYDTLNNFPRVMQQIGFSAEESQRAIDNLSEGIDGLPTTLDSVAGTAQRIGVMTKDLDGAVATTLALNNAFLASGASAMDAERGLEQYVQMLAKGEVDLQSWRTLQETMGVALNDVAEAFGYAGDSAQNDLYEALKEGHITFDEFNAKLIELSEAPGGFAERALTASGGIRTAITNVRTAIVKGVADVIGEVDKALGGTGEIEDAINRMKGGVQSFFQFVTRGIRATAKIFTAIYNALEPWRPLIAEIARGFMVAVGAIASFAGLVGLLKGVAAVIGFIVSPVGLIVAGITLLAVAFQRAYKQSEEFRNRIETIVRTLRDLFKGDISVVSLLEALGFTDEQIAKIFEFIGWVKAALTDFKDMAIEVLTTLWNAVQPIFSALGNAFRIIADIALMAWTGIIAPAVEFTWKAFQTAWKIIGPILELLGAAIGAAFEILKVVWDTIIKPVAKYLIGEFKGALDSASSALNAIGGVFDWLGDRIRGVVNWLKDVATWFKNIKVPDWVSSLGGKISNFFSGGGGGGRAASSHYHGIDYVPRDRYPAELHRGERVLTAQENKEYTAGKGRGAQINISGNTFHVREESDIQKIAYELAKLIEREEAQMA